MYKESFIVEKRGSCASAHCPKGNEKEILIMSSLLTTSGSGDLQGKIAKDKRRHEAHLRDEERKRRSPKEQLDILDTKLGVGMGAKKERARLLRLMKETANAHGKKKGKEEKAE
tara:strand:+ start:2200 stop:2541 length:342 start_codon:yes stop_codon:yes gene_type:complete